MHAFKRKFEKYRNVYPKEVKTIFNLNKHCYFKLT